MNATIMTEAIDKAPEIPDFQCSETERTISGKILPFNEYGKTSLGALYFGTESISIPSDITSVKLLNKHSPEGKPIGFMRKWWATDEGLWAEFELGSTFEADEAIRDAKEKLADCFSIEATGIERKGVEVQKSLLKAVALVPFPAFQSARVESVAAEHTENEEEKEENDMPNDDEKVTTEVENKDMDLNTGVKPQSIGVEVREKVHASLNDVMNYIHAVRTNEKVSDELQAALTDITQSGMTDAEAPQWLGELWSGINYTRRITPLVASGELKSMKARGWRWKTRPKGDSYAGNKAEIPTNSPAIESVEMAAARWAGGHDIDRAFFDFNESEILQSYWSAMAESYARFADDVVAKAIAAEGAKTVVEATDPIRGAAKAGLRILKTTDQNADFAIMNPEDIESVLEFTELDTPKFMKIVPIADPEKWVLTDMVPKGSFFVGTKSALKFFELPGSPIRVEAEHIAHGGRDAAMFAYYASIVEKTGGIVQVTVKPKPKA